MNAYIGDQSMTLSDRDRYEHWLRFVEKACYPRFFPAEATSDSEYETVI
jgi:hypothetical protein